MIKINVITSNKNWKKYLKNPEKYFKKKILNLNNKNLLLKKKKIEFSLLLSDNKEIKALNKKFRKKNRSTDVLSFPFWSKYDLKKKIINKNKTVYVGDIILNLNKISLNSNIKKIKNEIDRLWIHGFCHLMGNKHGTIKEFKTMEKIEKKYFNSLNK